LVIIKIDELNQASKPTKSIPISGRNQNKREPINFHPKITLHLDPYKTNNSPYNFLVLRSMGRVKLQGKAKDFTFLYTHGQKLHFSISIFLNG
jgi:hypothetical protein